MNQKRHFKVTGHIKGVGPVEAYRWAYSPEQAVKTVVLYYKKLYPELRIFVENREVYEKKFGRWMRVLPEPDPIIP